ncbi:HesA/MoeB/ThiF family protein [bacterium]|nr:HesA/MoeB/ThiF family protein [bacterium]
MELSAAIRERVKNLPNVEFQTLGTISVSGVNLIAADFGLNIQSVEIEALKQRIVPERYLRNFPSISIEDQIILLQSKVCVVGLGGLGGLVIETLARHGVGALTVIDQDRFDDSNLNRQLLSDGNVLKMKKTDVAQKRVESINPSVQVQTVNVRLSKDNANALIKDHHVVIDCLDSVSSRMELEAAVKLLRIPLVSGAISGFSGHITTVFPDDKGLKQVFSSFQADNSQKEEPPPSCLPQAVYTIAALEASEAIKIILKKGTNLRNRILLIDLYDNVFELFDL